MRRATWAVALLAVSLMPFSCAGELDGDEAAYHPPKEGGANLVCEDVPTLLAGRCGQNFCHGGDQVEANLDLRSPGVEARLVGVNASSDGCTTRQLIAAGAASRSFFLEKITSPIPECGEPMPVVGELTAAELACIEQWVQGLAAGGDSGAPPVVIPDGSTGDGS